MRESLLSLEPDSHQLLNERRLIQARKINGFSSRRCILATRLDRDTCWSN